MFEVPTDVMQIVIGEAIRRKAHYARGGGLERLRTAPQLRVPIRVVINQRLKRFLTAPAKPSRPVPKRTILAGSGTAGFEVICP